jgi:hypothetical protein
VRLKSDIWVKAYLRRAAVGGCPGVVVRRGDDEAGAIFLKVLRRNGGADLYGPASAGYDGGDDERRFIAFSPVSGREEAVDALIAREQRFDSDLWIVEIESQDGAHFLDGWLLATPD